MINQILWLSTDIVDKLTKKISSVNLFFSFFKE